MPGISLYDATIPSLQRGMLSFRNVLEKASTHPDAGSFPAAKLCEDMLPLTFQVQMASNTVKKSVWRITNSPEAEAVWADDETTLEQLIARCDRTIALLEKVDPKDFEGKESKDVEMVYGPVKVELKGKDYVFSYAMPNFFFHLQTAYAILRMKGVPLGKMDYLRPFMSPVADLP